MISESNKKHSNNILSAIHLRFGFLCFSFFMILLLGCKKSDNTITPADTSLSFTVNNVYNGTLTYTGLGVKPVIKFTFTEPVNSTTALASVKLTDASGSNIPIITTLQSAMKFLCSIF